MFVCFVGMGCVISPADDRNYADRRPGDSMSVLPSVGKSKYLILKDKAIKEISPLSKGEQILDGWVTIGHEVRSFIPCSQTKELWFQGDSPALNQIIAAYGKAHSDSMPYAPLFMTLIGRTTEPVSEGFGADYAAGFFAVQLVRVFPQGNCKGDLIYVDSPLPGERVSSPLRIRGYARGKWFFEGDFPVLLADVKGELIAKGYAVAKNAWMTEMFVPFESVLEFKPQSPGSQGTLILKKDNPTGQPKFDAALKIPIFFN